MRRSRKYNSNSTVNLTAGNRQPATPGEKVQPEPVISSERPRNVVDALFQHFAKWKPEVLKNASSIQALREKSSS